MMGEKEKEQEAGTEIERVFQYHKIIFIENNPMFPRWYSHTNTPSAVSPLTECLNKGDKSFCSDLASGKSRPGCESVQGSTALDKMEWVDGGACIGLNGGSDLKREGGFTPPCPLRV